jgi:hypothetical protein
VKSVIQCSAFAGAKTAWHVWKALVQTGHRLPKTAAELILARGPLDITEWMLDHSTEFKEVVEKCSLTSCRNSVGVLRLLQSRGVSLQRIVLEAAEASDWPVVVWAVRNNVAFEKKLVLDQLRRIKKHQITLELVELLENADAENDDHDDAC